MALLEYRITKNGYEWYDKVKVAIERIKAFEPAEGYWLAYGGGKDSVVCKALCDVAGWSELDRAKKYIEHLQAHSKSAKP